MSWPAGLAILELRVKGYPIESRDTLNPITLVLEN